MHKGKSPLMSLLAHSFDLALSLLYHDKHRVSKNTRLSYANSISFILSTS